MRLVYSATVESDRYDDVSDRDLLVRVSQDDERAFEELIRRKHGPLRQLVYRLQGDVEEARDIVQVTFLRVWENRSRYNRRYSPNTWIYRIATNLAIDGLRATDCRRRTAEPVRHHLRRVASGGATGLAELQEAEIHRIFVELSECLSERQRTVFILKELEDLSAREVAEIVGCRQSTVRNHLFNARRTLRGELIERYPEYAAGRARGEER